MKESDIKLIFKDLCCRLPYGVKVQMSSLSNGIEYTSVIKDVLTPYIINSLRCDIIEKKYRNVCRPFLYPMSSLTDDKYDEYYETLALGHNPTLETFDWLNKNHFDYRGLIEKELAIDATNLNIYIENERRL